MDELGAISDLGGRAGSYAMLSLLARHGRPGARRAAAARPRAGRRDRDAPALLRARVERAAGRARRRAAGRRRARLLPALPAHAAALPPAPALRAGGARAHRDLRHRLVRLQAAVHGADLGAPGGPARIAGAGVARGGPEPPPGPRPRPPGGRLPARSPRRCGPDCARAGTCSTRSLQDKAVKDRLRSYPHWLASRNLANEASDESVEALIEAVRSRYELARRWYRLKARLLGIDRLGVLGPGGAGGRIGRSHPLRGGAARSCSTATRSSHRSSG